jgi:DNA-binding transcriptional MerR regulator
MEILKEKYSITELSEQLGITDHALRYYEKEFNIFVPKDDRGRRYYTTELANIMYQIKAMRGEGLEIKAIKKILQSENIISEPPPVVPDSCSASLMPVQSRDNALEIKQFFEEFKEEIAACVSSEAGSVKEYVSKEIGKSKLELGACVENGLRKLESRMDKHFAEVDRSLTDWREKSKQGFVKRILYKYIK